ncbi:SDR family NAD(P)-dependent oxidoreductase [Sphingomonas sp. CGMCC 1.13654]|uniref:SDR family NAD(P)-dependent oxidoreductase n=1 Tax=Sphingomonas chungangi TaxID=2683589 RepID=A0A838L481_9SPHN|nr:SDR family NAD(P)-dependent oxidoreductase [Sphingomonas chungangi]MBA2933505.1 SDR family NAD(P)-dependent oxidoreductase [Sphingomonas chungangi]MVW54838.1 SDR family NAD(P)-dependent oxidoreductase [Sphingomonas chungangi]
MSTNGTNSIPHVVIVGGAQGLGLGAVKEHLKRGWRVTATMRTSGGLADISSDRLEVIELDVADWEAVDRFASMVSVPIDRLFIVAGMTGPLDAKIGDVTPEDFSQTLLVNALAPLRIIDRWRDALTATATVAIMSSQQGSITQNEEGGHELYRISKAAVNMGLRGIAARRADERTYIAINPGWVRTALGSDAAPLSVEESIPMVVDTLDRQAGASGIHFLDKEGDPLPW